MAEKRTAEYRRRKDELQRNDHFQGSKRHLDTPYSLHWHDYMEIELVIGGSGTQIINGTAVPLERGTITILRLTDYHEVVPTPRLDVYNLSFDEHMLSEDMLNVLNTAKDNLCFTLLEDEFQAMSQFCGFCAQEYRLPEPNLQYLKNLLECICIRLFRRSEFDEANRLAAGDAPLQRVLIYMHTHFREDPDLNVLAEIAHYSPNYFSTVFHQKIGSTYLDYLNRVKIRYAKQLLLTTQLKSGDIGRECGFRSFNSFLRTFKAYTGTSPMEYKRAKEPEIPTIDV